MHISDILSKSYFMLFFHNVCISLLYPLIRNIRAEPLSESENSRVVVSQSVISNIVQFNQKSNTNAVIFKNLSTFSPFQFHVKSVLFISCF